MNKILILSLLFTSCGLPRIKTQEGVPIKQCAYGALAGISPTVSDDTEHFVIEAIEHWNDELGVEFFKYIGRVPWRYYQHNSDGIVIVDILDVKNPRTMLRYKKDGCIISAKVLLSKKHETLNASELNFIFRHEFGHVLGYDHVLMNGVSMNRDMRCADMSNLECWK